MLATQFEGEDVHFSLDGAVDAAATDALRSARIVYAEGSSRNAVVDLSRVDFMDSAGIGWLIALDLIARARGGSVKLRNPSDRVTSLLHMSGLANRFVAAGS